MSDTKFSSETAKLAGLASGAARRAKNKENVADSALEDLLMFKALLMDMLKAQPCDKCKRTGPRLNESVDIVKTLLSINSELLNRTKGKPPTETTAQRYGSVSEYRRALEDLETGEGDMPEDLPPPPED